MINEDLALNDLSEVADAIAAGRITSVQATEACLRRIETWQPRTNAFLRHVWGLSATDVYTVGDSGLVMRYDGTQWRRMPTPTRQLLRGIWGTGPRDLFAVGDSATILRYDGKRWYPMTSPVAKTLRHVWGTGPTDVYAVGEGGVLLRFDGTTWRSLTSPTTQYLLQLWSEPGQGRVFAVGLLTTIVRGDRN